MDLQQKSGEIKKFSYVPTPDQQYLIELGVSLTNGEIFRHFNFLDLVKRQEEKYSFINRISVYNHDGFIIGNASQQKGDLQSSPERLEAFQKVVSGGKPIEIKEMWNDNEFVTYRYIPYEATITRGLSTNRVVEIIYNDVELKESIMVERREFYLQLAVIFAGAILLALLIARLIGKPMHLAFHDSLTGLKNRAAFEDLLREQLNRKRKRTALMMIDLDNFKQVNDQLGHIEGDRILQLTAKIIETLVGKDDIGARIGGDEFVIIFPDAEEKQLELIAVNLIKRLKQQFQAQAAFPICVSVSIGIALAEEEDDAESLYNKADIALYQSKENGKHQYHIFKEAK